MARKNESPQKPAMRKMMRGYLKDNDIRIKDGTDVNAVMCGVGRIKLRLFFRGKLALQAAGNISARSIWLRIAAFLTWSKPEGNPGMARAQQHLYHCEHLYTCGL